MKFVSKSVFYEEQCEIHHEHVGAAISPPLMELKRAEHFLYWADTADCSLEQTSICT